jgi:lipooligosaccharide transport system permease protein
MTTSTLISPATIAQRSLPKWGHGVKSVWRRNFLHFRYTFWVTLCWIFVEPLLFLLAIGYGLGNFVADINGKSYIDFYFPALLSVTAFSVPFFESTYNYYSKLTHQKTYQTILMTPVSASEILWAELLWGASKGFLSCLAVSIVARVLNIYHSWLILPVFLVLFLISFIGSACGLLFTTFAKNYDFFNYAISGFLLPMSFFSDTYFPISQLSSFVQILIHFFPLIHGVKAVRLLLDGTSNSTLYFSIMILIVFALSLTRWVYIRFRKLILE